MPAFSIGGLGGFVGGGFGIGPGDGGSFLPPPTDIGPGDGGLFLPPPWNVGDPAFPLGPGAGSQTPADPLALVATDPPDGSTSSDSPTSLSVTFDRPIDPFFLFGDFALRSVQADGSTNDTRLTTWEAVDPDNAARLNISLAAPLPPGQYQIVLLSSNHVMGSDGSSFNTRGQDTILSTFTIGKAGATLTDALELGVIGSSVKTVSGSLDLANDPSSVALYHFYVPNGVSWRLGAEVQAQRIGSPIDTVLTLFDARGNVLATNDQGRPDASRDPYFFTTIAPGEYYLGISGTGNVPGEPGGYNVVDGLAGTSAIPQGGGSFQLQIVVDPISTPTTVSSFQINAADPNSPQPTGFSIGFSGAIRVAASGSSLAGTTDRDLVLVDQNGRSWPIEAVAYNESLASLTYVFRQPLPAGHYQVKIPGKGGLTDLAGGRVETPGEPDGVLAEFDVSQPSSRPTGNNLGPVFPGSSSGVTLTPVDLQTGETWSTRFVTLASGLTSFQVNVQGGLVEVDLFDASGNLSQSFITETPRYTLPLNAGVWTVRIRALRGSPAHIEASLLSRSMESLLQNGIGQGPALSLRFVSTSTPSTQPETPASPGGSNDSSPSTPITIPGSFGSGTLAGPTLPGTSSTSSPSSLPRIEAGPSRSSGSIVEPITPGNLALTFGSQPVGRSEVGAEHVPAVGPGYVSGSIAYASNSATPPAQRLEESDSDGPLTVTEASVPLGQGRTPRHADSADEADRRDGSEPITDGALLAEADLMPLDAPPGVIQVPDLSTQLQSALSRILASIQIPSLDSLSSDSASESKFEDEGRVELTMFTSPMHLALGAFLAIQGRRTLSRWLGRRSQWKKAASLTARSSPPSPHLTHRQARGLLDAHESVSV